jgi:hypothetical protein
MICLMGVGLLGKSRQHLFDSQIDGLAVVVLAEPPVGDGCDTKNIGDVLRRLAARFRSLV